MNLRTLLLVVFLAAITVFALVNWTAFTTPTTLSLVLGSVQAPLGLLMLVLTGLLAVLFLVYIAYQQAGTIAAARRGAREMAAQRELADAAEASRFTELRTYLEAELRKLDTRIGESRDQAVRRIDAAEQALGARLAEATNGLAAHLGEVEDKLDRSSSARG